MNEASFNLARSYVQELYPKFKPFSNKFRVAGSIRRRKSEPTDIDIVVEPKEGMRDKVIAVIKELDPNASGQDYWRLQYKGIKIQIAISKVTGAMMLHTTGPSFTNINMRTKAKELGMLLNQYGLFKDGKVIKTGEKDIRNFLGYQRKIYTKAGPKKIKEFLDLYTLITVNGSPDNIEISSRYEEILMLTALSCINLNEDDKRRMGIEILQDHIDRLKTPEGQKWATYCFKRASQEQDLIQQEYWRSRAYFPDVIAKGIALDMYSKENKRQVRDEEIGLRKSDFDSLERPDTLIYHRDLFLKLKKYIEGQTRTSAQDVKDGVMKMLSYFIISDGYDKYLKKEDIPFYDEVFKVAKKLVVGIDKGRKKEGADMEARKLLGVSQNTYYVIRKYTDEFLMSNYSKVAALIMRYKHLTTKYGGKVTVIVKGDNVEVAFGHDFIKMTAKSGGTKNWEVKDSGGITKTSSKVIDDATAENLIWKIMTKSKG